MACSYSQHVKFINFLLAVGNFSIPTKAIMEIEDRRRQFCSRPVWMAASLHKCEQVVRTFFKSGSAVSQNIALETAAAVQMTIDGVKRTAQDQVTRALKDHSRFFLDVDIAAPKITIPTKFSPDSSHSTKLLLDLGNVMLCTQDKQEHDSSEEKDLYLQFNLVLSDVSAFFVDGDYW